MKQSRHIIFLLLAATLLTPACSSRHEDKKVVASVNDGQILLSDLQKEIAGSAKQHPEARLSSQDVEDRLNTMIERKLMIQEAVRLGLSEDERFVQTIKTYWEQTLIRELIDAKTREWADRLYVTNDELGQEYKRLQYRAVIRAARAATKELAEEYKDRMQKGLHVADAETVGPCFYDDVRQSPLRHAFDMEAGETKVFDHDGAFIVVSVVKKEKIALPPLAVMQDKIKATLMEQKRQKALADWVETLKRTSKIRINRGLLTGADHGR